MAYVLSPVPNELTISKLFIPEISPHKRDSSAENVSIWWHHHEDPIHQLDISHTRDVIWQIYHLSIVNELKPEYNGQNVPNGRYFQVPLLEWNFFDLNLIDLFDNVNGYIASMSSCNSMEHRCETDLRVVYLRICASPDAAWISDVMMLSFSIHFPHQLECH